MAQRLQAQQQHLQQSQSQSSLGGGFPNHQGSPYSNQQQQQRSSSSSSSSFSNPFPNANGQNPGLPPSSSSQNNHGRQSSSSFTSSGLSLPPANPSLPHFFDVDSLPLQHRSYANNPAALQLLYKDQPKLLETIARMMTASKRNNEGVPGMPGSALDTTGRRTSFGQQNTGGVGGGAGAGMPSSMVMPSKGRSSSSSSNNNNNNNNNVNHSTPTSAVLPPNFFPPGSVGRQQQQAPATPTPVSFNNNLNHSSSSSSSAHPSLSLSLSLPPSQPPPSVARIPTRPASPPEWTGSIHPSTLPTTFVQPLLPSKLELSDPTFNGALPEISKTEIVHVQGWIEKDKKYLKQVAEQRKLVEEKLEKVEAGRGRGIGRKVQAGWWEGEGGAKRRADWEGEVESFGLVWPEQKKVKREERRGRKEVRL